MQGVVGGLEHHADGAEGADDGLDRLEGRAGVLLGEADEAVVRAGRRAVPAVPVTDPHAPGTVHASISAQQCLVSMNSFLDSVVSQAIFFYPPTLQHVQGGHMVVEKVLSKVYNIVRKK